MQPYYNFIFNVMTYILRIQDFPDSILLNYIEEGRNCINEGMCNYFHRNYNNAAVNIVTLCIFIYASFMQCCNDYCYMLHYATLHSWPGKLSYSQKTFKKTSALLLWIIVQVFPDIPVQVFNNLNADRRQ